MALSFDTVNLVIESTASITDLPAFHASLRDWEDSALAMIYPVTHRWKALDLGGGAFFYQADLINGWTLKFPTAGSYSIIGNLNGTIVPVAGVYVERKTSAAYVTTAVGGGGATPEAIADAVRTELATELLRVSELHKMQGLLVSVPLQVTTSLRSAGDIGQVIAESSGTVTVTRIP